MFMGLMRYKALRVRQHPMLPHIILFAEMISFEGMWDLSTFVEYKIFRVCCIAVWLNIVCKIFLLTTMNKLAKLCLY